MNELAAGSLSEFLIRCLLLTLPASLLLLARYRRNLLRGMLSPAGAVARDPGQAETQPLVIRSQEPPDARAFRRRLLTLYGVAGLAASAVTTALLYRLEAIPFSVSVAWGSTWPLAATLPLILVLDRRSSLLVGAGWFVVGGAIVAVYGRLVLERAVVEVVIGYTVAVALLVFLPWAMFVLIVSRRLRAVAPVVLAGILVFVAGAAVTQRLFVAALGNRSLRAVVSSSPLADTIWFLLAALPVGLACWLALGRLSRLYEAKRSSDVQLVVDSGWLLAAFSLSAYLGVELGWWGLVGLTSFAVYRLVLEAGLRWWPAAADGRTGRGLLLLRVFGFRRRTERLFDALARRWRLTGSVNLISGTDLAGRTVDPGEIIRFLAGDLGDLFVRSPADLDRRMERLDERPDPDGRFRVNDFSCHDDTWKVTLEALLDASDVVLMDLRGFTPANSGCRFELETIVHRGRLPKTVFVIDDATDVELLRSLLPADSEPRLTKVARLSAGRLAALQSELAALAA